VVVYVPQAVAYLTLNGYVGPSRLVARKMTWTAPHALEVLFSPAHGFFFWTPLALLTRWVAACLLTAAAVQVYVAGSVESWTVAGAFGQRRFVALTVVLVVGLAALRRVPVTAPGRITLMAVVVLCVWWQVGLLAQFGAALMDRQRLEPLRNAYVTFVVLPGRLPELVSRYLFARDSFYKPPEGR
jgi:hypothetical protein